jgi:hypothetical protein
MQSNNGGQIFRFDKSQVFAAAGEKQDGGGMQARDSKAFLPISA